MATSDRTAVDAVLILESLARVLRASPNGSPGQDNEVQASYVDDSIGALVREAQIPQQTIDAARSYGGGEWDTALLYALFPGGLLLELNAQMRQRDGQ